MKKHAEAVQPGALVCLAVGLLTLAGCKMSAVHDNSALMPGQRFAIDEAQLPVVVSRASHSDVRAIKQLVDYYILYVGDDEKGIYWLEQLGNAGDVNARENVIHYYQKRPSPESTQRLNALRSRWNM